MLLRRQDQFPYLMAVELGSLSNALPKKWLSLKRGSQLKVVQVKK